MVFTPLAWPEETLEPSRTDGAGVGLLLIKKLIDVLRIVQAVVHEELELRDDAKLEAGALSEFVADLLHVGIDVVADFLGTFAGEDAQIAAAHAHVGTDAAGCDGHEDTACGLGLSLEDVAQLLLNQAGDFILSGCFHFKVKSEK